MEVSQNLPKCLQLPVQLNSWPAGAGLGKISPEKMMVGNRMQGKWLSTSSCRVSALERLRVTLLQQQPKHPQICQPAAKNKKSSSSKPKGMSSAYCQSLACRLRSTQLHQGVNTHHVWIMVLFCSFLISLPPSRKIHDLFTNQIHCINWVLWRMLHKDSPRRKKYTLGR